jgi:hypothetical protein
MWPHPNQSDGNEIKGIADLSDSDSVMLMQFKQQRDQLIKDFNSKDPKVFTDF